MPALEDLLAAILGLPPADQVELARRLIEHLERSCLWPPPQAPDLVLLFDGGSLGNPVRATAVTSSPEPMGRNFPAGWTLAGR